MKKYYIGLIVLAAFTLGLTGMVFVQAASAKQDNMTKKKADEISKSLNKYISNNKKIPDSLESADIKDTPSTISYKKDSDSEYTFCVTYKNASDFSEFGLTPLITGSAVEDYSNDDMQLDSSPSSYKSSTLYMPYSHKKGENCQTVKPYLPSTNYNTTRSSTFKSSDDPERKKDIDTLHTHLEAFYANKGEYPKLTDLNTASWRKTNMPGIADSNLTDPIGTSARLSSTAYQGVYGYKSNTASGASCVNSTGSTAANKCTTYTLSVLLSDGTTYSKKALN